MKYRVHVYEIVRVPIEVEADSQQAAVTKVRDAQLTAADDDYNPYDAFRTNQNAEYAEDTDGYLVDTIGDDEYEESTWYDKHGKIDATMHLESPCAGCGKTPQTCICGSALTPVVAILTVFSVGAVLIAQSGLVNALLARFAQVVR